MTETERTAGPGPGDGARPGTAVRPVPEDALPPRREWVLLVVLGLAALPWTLLQSVAAAVIPAAADQYPGQPGATWVLTGYLLAGLLAHLIAGSLGNVLGLRDAIVLCLCMSLIGAIMSAVATGMAMLVAGRVLQGACGAVVPLVYAVARRDLSPDGNRRVVATVAATFSLGGVFGLALAGPIVDWFSVGALFAGTAVLCAVALVGCLARVRKASARTGARLNVLSILLLGGSLSCLLLGLDHSSRAGWGNPRTAGLMAVFLAGLIAWYLRDRSHHAPVIDVGIFAQPGVRAATLASFGIGVTMFAMFILLPALVVSDSYGLGRSVASVGLVMVPSALVGTLLSFGLPSLLRRWGAPRVLTTGALVGVTGCALQLLHIRVLLWPALCQTIQGVGLSLALAACMTVASSVPVTLVAESTGVTNVMRLIGASVGSQAAGALLAVGAPPGEDGWRGFVLGSGFAVSAVAVVALAGLRLMWQSRRSPGTE